MSKSVFEEIIRGTQEARAYMEGAREGYKVTEPQPELLLPNQETAAAMNAARRGELVQAGSIENLLEDLHAEE